MTLYSIITHQRPHNDLAGRRSLPDELTVLNELETDRDTCVISTILSTTSNLTEAIQHALLQAGQENCSILLPPHTLIKLDHPLTIPPNVGIFGGFLECPDASPCLIFSSPN